MNIGAESGLNKTDIKNMLRSDTYGNLVRRDEKKAREANISSVPYFLVDGKHHIKGNKKPEQYTKELRKAWAEKYADDGLEELQSEKKCNRDRCET